MVQAVYLNVQVQSHPCPHHSPVIVPYHNKGFIYSIDIRVDSSSRIFMIRRKYEKSHHHASCLATTTHKRSDCRVQIEIPHLFAYLLGICVAMVSIHQDG